MTAPRKYTLLTATLTRYSEGFEDSGIAKQNTNASFLLSYTRWWSTKTMEKLPNTYKQLEEKITLTWCVLEANKPLRSNHFKDVSISVRMLIDARTDICNRIEEIAKQCSSEST